MDGKSKMPRVNAAMPDGNENATRARHRPHNRLAGSVEYRTARSRDDLAGAFRLLQRRYEDAGLSSIRGAAMRVLPYHLWSETQVFVAVQGSRVVGSISLVGDGNPSGVPMESTYPETVAQLRQQALPFGEVCSLTVGEPDANSSGEVFGQLTRLMMFHARYIGLERLIAVVHPRHAKFYQRAMGFRPIGGLSTYRQVGGQPGIPILGRVNDRASYRPRWRNYYFEGSFRNAELEPRPVGLADRAFFSQYLAPDHSLDRRRAA